MIEPNQIICGDCLDIMRDMPDDSVDLCLTDPPYGVGVDYSDFDDTQDNEFTQTQTQINVPSVAKEEGEAMVRLSELKTSHLLMYLLVAINFISIFCFIWLGNKRSDKIDNLENKIQKLEKRVDNVEFR